MTSELSMPNDTESDLEQARVRLSEAVARQTADPEAHEEAMARLHRAVAQLRADRRAEELDETAREVTSDASAAASSLDDARIPSCSASTEPPGERTGAGEVTAVPAKVQKTRARLNEAVLQLRELATIRRALLGRNDQGGASASDRGSRGGVDRPEAGQATTDTARAAPSSAAGLPLGS